MSRSLLAASTARVLELELVLARVAGHVQSDLGKARIMGLRPIDDLEELALRHETVAEVRERAASQGHAALGAARPLGAILARGAARGSVLEARDLLDVGATAGVAEELRRHFGADPGERPRMAAVVDGLPSLGDLERQIHRVLDDDGQVRDDASPELGRLRRQVHRTRSRVRERLDGLTRDHALDDVLQDAIVTERGGRLVVPVRSGQRDRLKGVVHDSSSSGQTLFVEPLEVLDDQNQLADLIGREREEIRRLLAELTGHVRAAAEALRAAEEAIGQADALQAIARYADAEGAERPALGASTLRLRRARHPLLDAGTAVPLDLEIPEDTGAVVITGPNTGGKTVALKTVGLAAALSQSGIPVLAVEAALPIYRTIAADIGDDQDLTANLSTFSGHLRHIARFLEACDEGALVLLDELGTGTDPAEGAALGIALIERFVERGSTVLASTHHDALKAFAHRHARVQNAAMEFDSETLAPTYRIRMGRPGRSNALEIAARLGLDPVVLARARELQSDDAVELDAMIRDLESDSAAVELRLQELEGERSDLEAERERLRERDGRRSEEHRRALEDADRAVREAVAEIREAGERKLRELEASQPATSARSRADRRARWAAESGSVRSRAVESLPRDPAPAAEEAEPAAATALRRGERVRVTPFGLQGVVLDDWDPETGDPSAVQVDGGGKRLVVRRDQVTPDAKPVKKRTWRGGTRFRRRHDVHSEIDLHGLTVEQALVAVDKYLDDALLAELFTVRLIHGVGTLALRDAIHRHLRNRPGVASFAAGDPTIGGVGVTVVHLED